MSLLSPSDAPAVVRSRLTRTEELRLQLADEIVRGALAPGAALDETALARRFQRVAHAGARGDPAVGGERPGRRARASRRRGGAAERRKTSPACSR